MNTLNIILWSIDSMLILGILSVYFYFTISINNWNVPKINTYNDVIDSKTLNSMVIEFQSMFNLKEYEVKFTDDLKPHRLFWNLKRREKTIVISKRLFESVGYELDYIVSRIWISAKEIQKDSVIRSYKIITKIIPIVLYALIGLLFLAQSFIFFYGIKQGESIESASSWIFWLWKNPILGILIMALTIWLSLNYLAASRLKERIELYYNTEIANLFKIVLEQFAYDFQAARTYAQDINIPILMTYHSRNDKWMGPFVY